MKNKVIGVTLVGGAYHNGFYCSGYGIAKLNNGKQIYVQEKDAVDFNGVLDTVEKQANTNEYRQRLDVWVKTGTMPPAA